MPIRKKIFDNQRNDRLYKRFLFKPLKHHDVVPWDDKKRHKEPYRTGQQNSGYFATAPKNLRHFNLF
jgi:hypothetical protein